MVLIINIAATIKPPNTKQAWALGIRLHIFSLSRKEPR